MAQHSPSASQPTQAGSQVLLSTLRFQDPASLLGIPVQLSMPEVRSIHFTQEMVNEMKAWKDRDEEFEPFTLGYTWNGVELSFYCATQGEADHEICLMFERCGTDVAYSID